MTKYGFGKKYLTAPLEEQDRLNRGLLKVIVEDPMTNPDFPYKDISNLGADVGEEIVRVYPGFVFLPTMVDTTKAVTSFSSYPEQDCLEQGLIKLTNGTYFSIKDYSRPVYKLQELEN
jgi:hypothetical protein